MNDLNSVLLEGELVADPVIEDTEDDKATCTFSIASCRFFKVGNRTEKEIFHFDVEASDRLGKTCVDVLKKERGVRVVDRLAQDVKVSLDGTAQVRTYIVAEHVEIKPEKKVSVS